MFLDLKEMTELARRRFEVEVPARAGWADNKRQAEEKLISRIAGEMGIETDHGDFNFSNKRILDAETTTIPRLAMIASWYPNVTTAVLRGGPKDGTVIQLPSPRFYVEYRTLAPGWQEFKADYPGKPLPFVESFYALTGYDTTQRAHVFYENDEMPTSDYVKLINSLT